MPHRAAARVYLISDPVTITDRGEVRTTPDGVLNGGLAALLDRVQLTMLGEGVVLLDARAAVALGLPLTAADFPGDGIEGHQVLMEAHAAGWSASSLRPWTTYHADGRPAIHVGILPAIDPGRSPLVCPWPMDTVEAFRQWHELTGTAYRATPGVAGIALLRELVAVPAGKEPTWCLKTGPESGVYESDYEIGHFRGRVPRGCPYAHGYDAVRMYLGAAGSCPLTPWPLKRIPQMGFDGTRSGWWLVIIAPWKGDERLPDPAGYIEGSEPGKPRWVTGPTLALLDELVSEGLHGGYEILDSWTGPIMSAGGGRPLRPWADRLRNLGLALPKPPKDAREFPVYGPDGTAWRHALAFAVKAAYRETHGLLNSATSRIYRPDWHYAVIAQARANLWRRMRKVGKATGRYPLWIDVDNVWYAAGTADPVAECPEGITLAEPETVGKLGQFTVKGSKEMRRGNRG